MSEGIFALTSGAGRAALAVWRLSGDGVGPALAALVGELPAPRHASLRELRGEDGEAIDQGLVLWFPAPASFTGEDVAELHLHGGRAVGQAISERLVGLGLRPADPGEFTRRAFMAGKLDLTQAEAITDLVAADTKAQRQQALGQLAGRLGRLYEEWRARLLRGQAHLEAAIDFADEDLPDGLILDAKRELAGLADEIAAHLADGHRGERLRDGLKVALLGAPNAGKSSLLNHLTGRDAAIVSAMAGTTRDIIEVGLDLDGLPLTLADSAGLRQGAEEIEQEGVRRARALAAQADIKLVVLDGALWPAIDAESLALLDENCLILLNKCDLLGANLPEEIAGRKAIAVSSRSGQGIDLLLSALRDMAAERLLTAGAPALTRARHRAALLEAVTSLRRAVQETLPELVAEDVRVAARSIGRITGRVDVETMLDIIFREFCIGK